MKKYILTIISLLLVACSSSANELKEEHYETISEDVVSKYEIIEKKTDDLNVGETEVVVKGVDGKHVVVYKVLDDGTKEFLTDWTYESKVNEVVMVGTKEETPEVSEDEIVNDGQLVDNNKPTQKPVDKPTAKPTPKPTPKPEAKPDPKPEAKPTPKPEAKPDPKPEAKPVRMGQLGNSGKEFKTKQEADAWGDSIIMSEASDEWGEKLGGSRAYGYSVLSVYWSDDTFTFTVNFRVK